MSKESESVIENCPAQKSPGPDGFTAIFSQSFKEVMPVPLKHFQNTKE